MRKYIALCPFIISESTINPINTAVQYFPQTFVSLSVIILCQVCCLHSQLLKLHLPELLFVISHPLNLQLELFNYSSYHII